MNSIDRSLVAGLLCGLLACFALPNAVTPCAHAGDDEIELRGPKKLALEERIELVIEEEEEQRERAERARPRRAREVRDGDGRMHGQARERETQKRLEVRRREMTERELDESRERERMGRERMGRERMERERHEQERREREDRAGDEQQRAMEQEIRELETRRQQIELRVAESELEKRAVQSTSKSDEVAIDAIQLAEAYMESAAAAEFFADVVDDVNSPLVKNQLRMKLAELYFKSNQIDKATAQIRMLIAPRKSGGH